jgi:SAM-dependent methyltransferase
VAVLGGRLAIALLNWATRNGTELPMEEAPAYAGKSKLEILMGAGIWDEVRGKTVLDFGCGRGAEAVEMVERGAARVIGLELRERSLAMAKEHAERRGVAGKCLFASEHHEPVEVIVCLDSFEHFADPADILRKMAAMLQSGGRVLISFGPTWYHPLGGHVFSVFPWAHLFFTERTLLRWRSLYKNSRGNTFAEVGLNQMTIRRFRRLVDESPFRFAAFEAVPIRKVARFHNRFTREFTTSLVRCALVKKDSPA